MTVREVGVTQEAPEEVADPPSKSLSSSYPLKWTGGWKLYQVNVKCFHQAEYISYLITRGSQGKGQVLGP